MPNGNATLVAGLVQEIIDGRVPSEGFADLQKVNLLAMAYPVVPHEIYRGLCDTFARQTQAKDLESLSGWKRTWSMASITVRSWTPASIGSSGPAAITPENLKIYNV